MNIFRKIHIIPIQNILYHFLFLFSLRISEISLLHALIVGQKVGQKGYLDLTSASFANFG